MIDKKIKQNNSSYRISLIKKDYTPNLLNETYNTFEYIGSNFRELRKELNLNRELLNSYLDSIWKSGEAGAYGHFVRIERGVVFKQFFDKAHKNPTRSFECRPGVGLFKSLRRVSDYFSVLGLGKEEVLRDLNQVFLEFELPEPRTSYEAFKQYENNFKVEKKSLSLEKIILLLDSESLSKEDIIRFNMCDYTLEQLNEIYEFVKGVRR